MTIVFNGIFAAAETEGEIAAVSGYEIAHTVAKANLGTENLMAGAVHDVFFHVERISIHFGKYCA